MRLRYRNLREQDAVTAVDSLLPNRAPEIHSERAASLLDDSLQLAAPDLLYPEAGHIVWKKVGGGELEAEEAREIIVGLKRVPIAVAASSLLLEAALDIALVDRRTVNDSLYAALAVAYDCVFVTADDRLAGALAGGPLGKYVRTLSSYPAVG